MAQPTAQTYYIGVFRPEDQKVIDNMETFSDYDEAFYRYNELLEISGHKPVRQPHGTAASERVKSIQVRDLSVELWVFTQPLI